MESPTTYLDLLYDVHIHQQCARYEWIACNDVRHVVDDLGEKMILGHFICEGGVSTTIPSYMDYDFTWKSASFTNPFDFDWLKYDRRDEACVRYIELVICTLNEQLLMWEVDGFTKGSWIFGWISEFTKRLFKLYEFDCCAALKEVMDLTELIFNVKV
jgi:hypothetical protein